MTIRRYGATDGAVTEVEGNRHIVRQASMLPPGEEEAAILEEGEEDGRSSSD